MRASSICLAAVIAALAFAVAPAGATTYVVNDSGDAGDADLNVLACGTAGGQCTLRAAIQQANWTQPDIGTKHTIHFALGAGQTIPVPSDLPTVTRTDLTIDGCSGVIGTSPCVGLRSTGADTGIDVDATGVTVRGLAITAFSTGVLTTKAGLIVRNDDLGVRINHTTVEGMDTGVLVLADGARIGCNASTPPCDVADRNVFAGNGTGLSVRGADAAGIYGNRFGVLRNNTVAGNGRGIAIAGLLAGGDASAGSVIGEASAATDDPGAGCSGPCNMIAGSSDEIGGGNGAGIDLSGSAIDETPSGDTTIAGNWIGVDPFGEAAGNDIGVKVGAAGVAAGVMIGGVTAEDGNLIAGNNGPGIEQTGGTGALNVLRNVFGESPDREESLPNGPTNARLAGAGNGHDTLVVGNHFGAATYGLELTGPLACVSDNFFTPEVGAYGEAAVVVQKDATSARIGNTVGCVSGFARTNHFLYTSAGKPAVLIRGADDVRVLSNFFGVSGLLPAPLAGPAVRIEDSGADVSNGGLIGSDDDAFWNAMWRSSGPAVQLAGGATGITIAGNEGIAFGDFGSASSLFADLLSVPGLGNSPSGGQNGGIQPPAIGVATEAGVAGTGVPGAVVRILQQWRDDDPNDGVSEPYPQGYTLPTTPGAAIVAADGTFSLAFSGRLPKGQKLTASQTTASGSSEFAAIRTATTAPDLPVARITAGPDGTTAATSATFSFSTPTPGASLECGVDGADFAPCASPMTLTGLTQGPHQFRVQARLGSAVSLPATRTWNIELPAPTPPAPVAKTAALRFASVVTFPSSKRCVSRRLLRLRLRKPSGQRIVYAEIRLRGRKTRTLSGGKLALPIDLRGLPKGSFKVRLKVVLSSGKVLQGSKTYRTCAAKKKAKKKR